MNAKKRIAIIRLSEKLKKNPQLAKEIGVSVITRSLTEKKSPHKENDIKQGKENYYERLQ